MSMRAYMGYCIEPYEGACLIFAHSAKEAKRLAWGYVSYIGGDYVDVRVRWLRNRDHLFLSEADQEKLARGEAHAIDEPKYCNSCEFWGDPIGDDGYCDDCRADRKEVSGDE